MGVVNQKSKAKKELKKQEKDIANSKPKENGKVKKKKSVSCLQCIKPNKNDGGLEGKYRVAAPELMQDTFMSDSEDEGGEVECPIQQQQQYRYMNSEAGTLHRAKPLEDSVTDGHLWPSNNDKKVSTIDRQPLDIGFLVSFVVDARGGAMKAKRRGGVRIIVPPAACAAPTRVTCRAATRRAPAAAPPPLMEGEALASRLLELQPQGAKFLAPVIIEVPIFTASCREREIVVLRSDTGETWQDHYLHNNDNPMIQEALQRERQDYGNTGEALGENGERVTRIVTCDFPHYLAVVSRVRQEVHVIGPEGGTVSSAHIPQVQALFPAQALTKRIRVGLQAHGAPPELARRVLPRHAAVSPVITVEPRRRKFHRSITLAAPLPQVGQNDKQSTANLRLLCSIMGGQARAVWEDVTGSTPLTVTDDCASFTTTVSARFWLMNCQNVTDATKLATELYRDMLLVPFEVRIVVLGKRLDALEGRLLVLYITDRYAYDTLLHQEHYTEVAHSTSVQFLDGREVYLEFSGNLVPVTKSGSQPMFTFEAFKDNRVEFTVRVKHHEETPSGRIYFMNEPKVAKGEQSPAPACVLDVELPDRIAPRAGKSHLDCLNLDQSGFDALNDELSFHWGDHNNSLGPASLPHDKQLNGHDKIITNGDVKYTETKDADDKKPKPQVNGDTLHVDSNKTKATFDSDEDKTPMNTLKKGKKKPDGFFGGITDKVKNVFSHSEDGDEKESSPKPQPKPRETKEKSPPKPRENKDKSPPKPAPRIINEDLLDKVEDMFRDLKTKPHQKDEEEFQKEVYSTKLVVDEVDKPLSEITEDVYEQYANMQPVETPLRTKVADPFQFPKCCDGKKYKHTHDETSNVEDMIEQANFVAHEKLGDASDKISSGLHDGLTIIEEEKSNIAQKTTDLKDDLIEAGKNLKDDLKIKEEEVKIGVQSKVHDAEDAASQKLDDLSKTLNTVQGDISGKTTEIQANIVTGIDNFKSSTKDTVDSLANTAKITKDDLKSKANEMDFAARERAEQLYLGGQEVQSAIQNKANDVKQNATDFGKDLKNKTEDSANAISSSIQDVKENLSHKLQDIKSDIKETTENTKDAINEKANEISETVEKTKQKGKKEGKKKAKEGKNFFTGLVSNIFGEKEKLEEDVKGKIAKGKEAVNDLADEVSAKKNKVEQAATNKQSELKKGAEDLAQSVKDEKDKAEIAIQDGISKKEAELKQGAQDLAEKVKNEKNKAEEAVVGKVEDIKDAVHNKKEEAKQTFNEKTLEIGTSIQNKTDDITSAAQEKAEKAKKEFQEKKDLVVNFLEMEKEAVLDKTNDTKKAIQDKKDAIAGTIVSKKEEIGAAMCAKTTDVVNAAQDKKSEIIDALYSTKDEVGKAIQEKSDKAKDAVHDTAAQFSNFIQNKTEDVGKAIHDTKDNVEKSIHEKKEQFASTVHDKADEANNALQSKTDEVESAILNKRDELQQSLENKKDEIQNAASSELHRIRQEAELTTDQIKKSAEDALNSASNKKDEIQSNISRKTADAKKSFENKTQEIANSLQSKKDDVAAAAGDAATDAQKALQEKKDLMVNFLESERDVFTDKTRDLKKGVEGAFGAVADRTAAVQSNVGDKVEEIKIASREQMENIQRGASAKVGDLQRSAREAFGDVQHSTLSTFDRVESAVKGDDADEESGWEPTRKLQGKMQSFQSSAGDTFDSLDDSAREVIGDLQTSTLEFGNNAKELFGDVKSSFEGFQVSADNKLEDVKGEAGDQLEDAGARLEEAATGAKDRAREAERAVVGAVSSEADAFTSNLNDLGNSVFGFSGKGFMKDSSTKLMESERAQTSPSPHKKSSGIPKLKRKK